MNWDTCVYPLLWHSVISIIISSAAITKPSISTVPGIVTIAFFLLLAFPNFAIENAESNRNGENNHDRILSRAKSCICGLVDGTYPVGGADTAVDAIERFRAL